MRRIIPAVLVAVALLGGALTLSACQRKVEVTTGTKVVCSYGHAVSDDLKTIKVPRSSVAEYQVRTKTIVCDRHKKLETLYGEAQAALKAGDVDTAKKKLAAVIAGDASFGNAKSQLDQIAAGKKPVPDGSKPRPQDATNKPTAPNEGDTSGPTGSLKKWTPDTLDGFSAQRPAVDATMIARNYSPSQGSKAFMLVMVAEQFRNSKEAAGAVDSKVKRVYTRNAKTMEVNGHEVYFGTDGKRFAAASFNDGSVMVALEMSARDGSDPGELRSLVEDVLKQLP